ncbi:UNVERIFIED_CONTAM: Coiled-coil and C2 domain-containing protein 1B [Siphonaria sp. JEL0065]|nr:Coiled-coil and C2 domain-containing protein 1B [Siphonaria sp. JEL0065]
MSWFGSGTNTSKKNTPVASNENVSLDGFEDIDNLHISDVDLENDAALMAELAGLEHSMGLSQKPKPVVKQAVKQAAKPGAAAKPISKVKDDAGLVEFEVPIIDDFVEPNVELTEDDLNDPDLLHELSLVGGNSHMEVKQQQQSSTMATSANTSSEDHDDELAEVMRGMSLSSAAAPVPVAVAPPTQDSPTAIPLVEQLKSSRPEMIGKYIELAKIKAMNAKTTGDMFGATEANKAILALEQRYNELVNEASPPPPPLIQQDAALTEEEKQKETHNELDESAVAEFEMPTSVPVSPHSLLDVKRRQLEYKQTAIACKSAGDVQRAREILKISRSMQDTIDLADAGGIIPASFKLPPPPPAAPAPATPAAVAPKPTPQTTTPIKRPSATISPKQAATPTLSQTIAYATSSSPRQSQSQPPQPQQQPTTPSLATTASFTPSFLANTKPLLQTLHTQLQTQIESCTQIAHYLLKSNQKPLAVEYHKRKKLYQSDLQVLDALIASADGSMVTHPSFRYEVVRYQVEKQCADLGAEELEVSVLRGFDLSAKGTGVVSNDLETYVVFDLGLPSGEEGKSSAEGKGQSSLVSKNMCPEYEFSKKVRIDRTSRQFHRHLERKRVVFDVYHQAKGWGGISLFSKPVHIGRASVALSPLLTKTEVHEVVDLVDGTNPRKAVGGKLEVKLRVRVPMLKQEIIVKEERWVVVDFSGELNTSTPAPQPAAVVATPQIHQPVAPFTPSSTPLIVAPASAGNSNVPSRSATPVPSSTLEPGSTRGSQTLGPPKSTTAVGGSSSGTSRGASPVPSSQRPSPNKPSTPIPGAISSTDIDIEQLEVDFLNPDLIASSEVLYKEMESLDALITTHKKPVPEELSDRKMAYELRLNILGAMVASGQLKIDKYLEKVKESIVVTKKVALTFKTHGKVELARQALVRVKTMVDEVTETEAAIASGELQV